MNDIQSALGYAFKDGELLRRALTLKGVDERFNNESLECLGDSLIGFVAACKFYADGLDEGGITARKKAVVNDRALTEVSRSLGLDKALIKPKGAFNNKKAVPSAYEAVAAAIYLDGGMEQAQAFILRTLDFSREERDYIALLQEALQEHDFVVTVQAEGLTFIGRGGNTAAAKRDAAERAYRALFGG